MYENRHADIGTVPYATSVSPDQPLQLVLCLTRPAYLQTSLRNWPGALRDQRISRPAFAIGPVPYATNVSPDQPSQLVLCLTRPTYLQTSLRNWYCALRDQRISRPAYANAQPGQELRCSLKSQAKFRGLIRGQCSS
ncbi:hypothetical protein DPMN_042943 [Dreissena polymorpha]|uniref:Uncharacterized protein n=1 Tax=Dreissena polymorpha TaxID=45954 RepID=A0A9D4D0G1_DREPO|nr:hypothetical protein DPMN_042943 [Dreissena polymorpha]